MLLQWVHAFTTWLRPEAPSVPPLSQWLDRPHLGELSQWDMAELPPFVQESAAALKYRALLGELDWAHFPERPNNRAWPGPPPAPRAPLVAAYLVKLDKGLPSMPKLCEYLGEQPGLVWLLGFPLTPSANYSWGFDVAASLPSSHQFSRILRQLRPEQVSFLLKSTVQLLDLELATLPGDESLPRFGDEISLDTKHILAWVRENNPKDYVPDRFDKTRQPKGDPDCKLGCKKKRNTSSPEEPTPEGQPTPTKEAIPASQTEKGEFYWGYASGVVATKVGDWGEFVLAEYTQTFDQSDPSYFFPLLNQTEQNLGRMPRFGAFDGAFDAFYVYAYFHQAGGFAAVPYAGRADHAKTFDADGLPLCAAALAMPLKSTFQKKSHCLVPHECGRHACPLLFPAATGECCPVNHENWNKEGCITTLPTSIGNRIRHQLDRHSQAYTQLYNQRTATERINSQAVELGIERPKLRNQRSIANQNTLTYVLINLRGLQRLRQRKAESTAPA